MPKVTQLLQDLYLDRLLLTIILLLSLTHKIEPGTLSLNKNIPKSLLWLLGGEQTGGVRGTLRCSRKVAIEGERCKGHGGTDKWMVSMKIRDNRTR